jgi:hypothetical protein
VEKEPLLATNNPRLLKPNRRRRRRRNRRSEAQDLKGPGSLAVCSRKTKPKQEGDEISREKDERVE